MAHECSTPYIYHGYYIFPMTKMQYFMHSKDEYEYYRSVMNTFISTINTFGLTRILFSLKASPLLRTQRKHATSL